ncbi:MAG TPA: 16S rRNA (uracil(1498)-N(3))-methyltransferase [Steroidobacteraceae bacterium]|nr:16S rRNA (uracil(1498)-N(3))-methyltransferase [Steroidobacteraceae bacterium]
MRLTRVHVTESLQVGKRIAVEGAAANHITRVLRLRAGEPLTLFNGNGAEYAATILEFRRDTVLVEVGPEQAANRESPLPLTLAQGISRGERMDWILQKATELGGSRIVPVFTERSVVRLDAKQAERKLQHWRAIAVAACEQCGRNRVPEITQPTDLFEFLGNGVEPRMTRLLLSPISDVSIDEVSVSAAGVTVLIGPEGGLTDNEHEVARRSGFTAVRMGPRVLRTETAAIAALTILQHRFGDLGNRP